MNIKSFVKLMIVMLLCLSVVVAFTACKDDGKKVDKNDESQPNTSSEESKNDDEGSGDIYIPNGSVDVDPNENPDANFEDDNTDTDKDGTPDVDDPDDDNDGVLDEDETDNDKTDDNNDTSNKEEDNNSSSDEEKPDYGNQGPIVFF